MRVGEHSLRARARYAWGALAGGIVGCVAAFVYLNVDPFERMVANVDGFPRWSFWQLPFTLPEAALGAVAGMGIVAIGRFLRRRTSTV
jgi:H+/Cl- antiporter ClcA